jgi:choice-of-anchor B domain-containing protein
MNSGNSLIRFNDVWGFEQKGREYAVLGSNFGTHFIDVTNSNSPKEVGRLAGAYSNRRVVHRDFKKFKDYIYGVCDQGKGISTLQIVDVSKLPESIIVVYDTFELFSTSHNIYIDTAKSKLYSCTGGGLSIYSLKNPVKPKLIEEYLPYYVHDLFARNDTAYLNCGEDGLVVVDFSDSPNKLFSMREYKDDGYNHSGWLTEDGSTYVFADETRHSRVKVCDVSNLKNTEIVSFIPLPQDSTIPHNVLIKDNFVYLSYYDQGLLVYDITDPIIPIKVAEFNLVDSAKEDVKGFWGVYPFLPSGKILVSDIDSGLIVLEHALVFPVSTLEKEKLNGSFKLFPNPVKQKVKIEMQLNYSSMLSVELMDCNGRILYNLYEGYGKAGNNTLNLNLGDRLSKGIYVVNIKVGNRNYYERIVK